MKKTKILSIKKSSKQTFDITVNNNHNFFCNGHLIHNCDYRGNIGVILINLSNEPFIIKDGERICQMVIAKHESAEWDSVDTLEKTERGEGGFGHTGVK